MPQFHTLANYLAARRTFLLEAILPDKGAKAILIFEVFSRNCAALSGAMVLT
jgi:hypothetical protein